MTKKTAASRYARALLDVALHEKADLDRIEHDLAQFADLFAQHATLAQALLNPAVPVPRKRAVIAELTARIQSVTVVAKLLALLAGRDRLVLLPELLGSYRERLLDYRKIVRAQVTTAAPIEAERAQDFERRLGRATGRTVRLETRTDPSIVGGVVARIGSTVYDGSVVRQLERMRERLIENA